MWLVDFALSQPVLANLTFIILMIMGLYALFNLPRDINPDVSFETAIIYTVYPGATPEDVEKLVTIPIEDAIRNVKDLNRVISTSQENISEIVVEFTTGADIKERVRDLKDEVDKVNDLPEEAEDPEIFELDTSGWPAISVVLYSAALPEGVMKNTAEDIQDKLEDIPGISSVNLAGIREREILVSVDRASLERHNLSLSQVADAIAVRNRDFPAGKIQMDREEFLVRTVGEYRDISQIAETVVFIGDPGNVVRVRDVASVLDTFEDPTTYSRFNGQPGVGLSVLKEKDADTHAVVRATRETVQEHLSAIPNAPEVSFINDMTVLIDDSIGVLKNNALIGLVLVVLSLMFFIGFRNSFLAALGIPFCFLLTFAVMRWMGISINGITVFSLVLVLGIVVDDAIIIIENIYRYMEKGLRPREAARYAGEVATPVISSVTTTMAVFFPMMLMVGIVGEFLSYIPKIVIVTLAASLIEALFILPSHVADFGRPMRRRPPGDRVIRWFQKRYKRLVFVFLRNRGIVISAILVLAVFGALMIFYMGVDMFADEEFSQFSVRLKAPEGTSLKEMSRIVALVEESALTLPEEEVTGILGWTGIIFGEYGVSTGSHMGEVTVDLVEKEDRKRSLDEIIEDLRGRIGTVPGIRSIEYHTLEGGPPVGEPVAIQVKGKILEGVDPLVEEIKGILEDIPGVKDIRDDHSPGKNQLSIRIDPDRAAQYGLTAVGIGAEIRAANEGLVSSVFRDGDEEVDIVVRNSGVDRSSPSAIGSMRILSSSGALVPIRNVADISYESGPSEVNRRDFERTVRITADVDTDVTTSAKANQAFTPYIRGLLAKHPGFKIEQGGEYEKTQESFASLTRAFVIALFLVYMILGIQFQSFSQPFVIMLTVPFAFIGVISGLIINGHPFSLVAFVAVVALAGIVVNDSLILVDFINKKRESGISLYRAIVRSGMVRMRPVMMTSLTTILGLLPMSLSLGGASAVWKPMADSIIWGLVFSTVLTLLVIPVAYSYLAEWTLKWNAERFGYGEMEIDQQ
jgi:multidrug efflux pump subunit AcrB